MSLYHESAEVLDKARNGGGSLKSIIFGQKSWKSDPRKLFALSAETAKWSEVLSEVVEKSGLLNDEKQLSPLLALGLVHDLLLSKRGIALPQGHGLHTAISRHKARLTAELTKARLRRGFTSLDDLRACINLAKSSTDSTQARHPRWIRINTLKTKLEEQLRSTFSDYEAAKDLLSVTTDLSARKAIWIDEHVSDLVAISPKIDITSTEAYRKGEIILQDKASCFPALLLDPTAADGYIVDACAAPGNKTTHLAALRSHVIKHSQKGLENDVQSLIFACEKDAARSQTLEKMVKLAGAAKLVRIREKQDFLKLDPRADQFKDVTALLLDPSCSGSGIVGRDDGVVTVHLPSVETPLVSKSKKRKRGDEASQASSKPASVKISEESGTDEHEAFIVESDATKLQERLTALSAFQLRILQHAMSFPAATKITYSTCSIHDEENEAVVIKALVSDIAKNQGWRILPRAQQVSGMQKWSRRGSKSAVLDTLQSHTDGAAKDTNFDIDAVAEACIRCHKNTEDMTMGFFVAGFVRDLDLVAVPNEAEMTSGLSEHHEGIEEEWNGFSDDEG